MNNKNQTPELPSNDPEAVRAVVLAQVNTAKVALAGTVTPLRQVLDEIAPQGTDAKFREFIDHEITVHSVSPFMGIYGPAAYCIITDENGVMYNFVVGAKVVLPKFLMAMDRVPFSCRVVEREGGMYGRYLDVE